MPRSARPGRSSGSSSGCWPNRASTQAWNRVPNRAARRRRPRHRPGQVAGERLGVVAAAAAARSPTGCRAAAPRSSALRSRRASASSRSSSASHSATRAALDHVEVARRSARRVGGSATSSAAASRRSASAAGAGRRPGPRRVLVGSGLGVALGGLSSQPSVGLAPLGQLRRGPLAGRPRGRTACAVRPSRYDVTDEPVRGAGERDVAEPELLLGLVRPGVGALGVERRPCRSRAAAAGRRRHRAAASGSTAATRSTACGSGWTGTGPRRRRPGTPTSHSSPLARWTVSSLTESASVGVATSSPLPCSSSAVQVGQQRRQRDVAVDGLEVGDRVDEQVEVVAPGAPRPGSPPRPARRRRRVVSMIRRTMSSSGSPTCARSIAQLARQQREPLAAPRRSTAASPGSASASSRRRDLGRVDAVGDLHEVVVESSRLGTAPALPGQLAGPQARAARRSRGPIAQRGPVSRVSSDGVGGHVVQQVQHRDHLGHLGQPQQPAQADDLDRDPGAGQRVEDLLGVRVVAGQHPDVGPGRRRSSCAAVTASASAAELVARGSRRPPSSTSPVGASGLGSSGRPARARHRAARRAGWRPRGSAGRSGG